MRAYVPGQPTGELADRAAVFLARAWATLFGGKTWRVAEFIWIGNYYSLRGNFLEGGSMPLWDVTYSGPWPPPWT